MPGRTDFLSQAAPENYVAGLGRGGKTMEAWASGMS